MTFLLCYNDPYHIHVPKTIFTKYVLIQYLLLHCSLPMLFTYAHLQPTGQFEYTWYAPVTNEGGVGVVNGSVVLKRKQLG